MLPRTLIVNGEPYSLASDPVRSQLEEWIRAGNSAIRRFCSVCKAYFALRRPGFLEAGYAGGRKLVEKYLTAWQKQTDGSWKIFRNIVIPDK